MKKSFLGKLVVLSLVFNLVMSAWYPLLVYSRVDEGSGGGGGDDYYPPAETLPPDVPPESPPPDAYYPPPEYNPPAPAAPETPQAPSQPESPSQPEQPSQPAPNQDSSGPSWTPPPESYYPPQEYYPPAAPQTPQAPVQPEQPSQPSWTPPPSEEPIPTYTAPSQPEPTQAPVPSGSGCGFPIVDSYTQDSCSYEYTNQAYQYQQEQEEKLAEQRNQGGGTAGTLDDSWNATVDLASAMNPVNYVPKSAYDILKSRPASQQDIEVPGQLIADAKQQAEQQYRQAMAAYGFESDPTDPTGTLNPIPVAEKAQRVAKTLGLPEDTPQDQVFSFFQTTAQQAGIKVKGDFNSFTVGGSEETSTSFTDDPILDTAFQAVTFAAGIPGSKERFDQMKAIDSKVQALGTAVGLEQKDGRYLLPNQTTLDQWAHSNMTDEEFSAWANQEADKLGSLQISGTLDNYFQLDKSGLPAGSGSFVDKDSYITRLKAQRQVAQLRNKEGQLLEDQRNESIVAAAMMGVGGEVMGAGIGAVLEAGGKVVGPAVGKVVGKVEAKGVFGWVKNAAGEVWDSTGGKLLSGGGGKATGELTSADGVVWLEPTYGEAVGVVSKYSDQTMVAAIETVSIPAEVAAEHASQAQRLAEYLVDHARVLEDGTLDFRIGPDAPADIKAIFQKADALPLGIQNGQGAVDALKSIFSKDFANNYAAPRVPRIQQVTDEAKRMLNDRIDGLMAEGGSQKLAQTKTALEKVTDPDNIVVLSRDEMQAHMGSQVQRPGGYYSPSTRKVYIAEDCQWSDVCQHEFEHAVTDALNADGHQQLRNLIGAQNADILFEGATEALNVHSLQAAGQRSYSPAYGVQTEIVNTDLARAIAVKQGISLEQARGLIDAKTLLGDFTGIVKAAGGKDVANSILNKAPAVYLDQNYPALEIARQAYLSYQRKKAITIVGAGVAEGGIVLGGILLYFNNQQPQPTPTRMLLPLRMIQDVQAAEKPGQAEKEKIAVNTKTYEALVKQQMLKNILAEEGQLDSETVKAVMAMDVLGNVSAGENKQSITTNSTGTYETSLPRGRYTVGVEGINGWNIQIPAVLDLTENNAALPIALTAGDGQVKKAGTVRESIKSDNPNKDYGNVTVILFEDSNSNGKMDSGEKILPWAGVKVTLKKIDQEKKINLLSGWNLITLTALPNQALTASLLIAEIGKQGGEAVAVSSLENGAWKTYVARGDKNYSIDDFPVVPGQAYFIKALKPADFKFIGQEFAVPVKVTLQAGWNAIGVPVSEPYRISGLLGKMDASDQDKTGARWESGLWDALVLSKQDKFGEDFAIEPGRGYVVKIGQSKEFSP